MEKITNIEIKNFKSIRHAEIKDCRRVNIFIGYPNVGKSNILEALAGFSILNTKAYTGKSIKSLVRYTRLTDFFHNANIKENSSVILNSNTILSYRLPSLTTMHHSIIELVKPSQINEITKREGSILLNEIFDIEGIYSYSEGTDIEKSDVSLIKKYSFNQAIEFNSLSLLDLAIPFGENLSDIIEVNPELRIQFNDLLKDYDLNLHYDRSTGENEIELRKELSDGTTITLNWNLLADTLRRLFFYKAAILSNQQSVLLFEEPEAQMFPPYIRKLTTDILMDKNENQYFVATHSPYVLDELILEAGEDLAVYLVDYKSGETIIKHLSSEDLSEIRQYGVDLFFNIESYLKNG